MEEPITFKNREGKKLFGIVHIPENSPSAGERIGINLLNPGIKYRVAPHRLSMKLARRLCQKGFHVLRFDPSGIGDSDGELPENFPIYDIWGRIQTGLFVPDAIDSNNFFIDKFDINKLILIGNCGGAITSLLASAEDPRVSGLCLVDPPVYLLSSNKSFADTIAEKGEKADWYFSEYIMKMMNLNSWYRLFTLKTNYKALWKVISVKLQKRLKSPTNNARSAYDLETLFKEKKLNRLFFKSFKKFFQGNKPILFVLAGNDPGIEIFQNYFEHHYLKQLWENGRSKKNVDIFLIENANHIYSLTEWKEALLGKILSWLDTHSVEKF